MAQPSETSLGLEAYLEKEEKGALQQQLRGGMRLLALLTQDRWIFLGGFAVMMGSILATLAEPWIFGLAIDRGIVPKDQGALLRWAALFLGVEVFRVVCVILQNYLFELLGQRVTLRLRGEMIRRYETLPVAVFDRQPVGRMVTRVTNDLASLSEMFSAGFVTLFGNALLVLGIFAWLLILHLRLGLIVAAAFPLILVFSVYFSGRLSVAFRNARSKLSASNAFLAENLLGMRIVQLFGRQQIHREKYSLLNRSYFEAQMESVRNYAYFQPMLTWMAGFTVAAVLYAGGNEVLRGGLQVGLLVAFISYAMALFQPLRDMADKWSVFLSGLASLERIFSILDQPGEYPDQETEKVLNAPLRLQGQIEFENVWFAYEGEHWVLKDFSLRIEPGSRVGIVGHTGAGKTTLISLLLRFYEPQRGRILIDGRDLREFSKRELRSAIGLIQQDVFLFSGSVEDNIRLWRGSERAWSASARALAERLGLGQKLELSLEERGGNLSMGEKQAIAFLRALEADPSLWILDEATAHMDSTTEQELGACLGLATRGKTSLTIAHRLATVRDSDLIVVLHEGRLVESGSHSALLARDGVYRRLYRYQSVLSEGPGLLSPE